MTAQAFTGFPKDVLSFLEELADNNKEWFEANKQRYADGVLAHAPAFVESLGRRLQQEISPAITFDTRTNGAGSMMRIYRDTRFSKDKTPYKTNIAFVFWEGARKKMENPSFGLQFGSFGAGLYGGQWQFPKETIDAYRSAVLDDKLGPELESILDALAETGGYEVGRDMYKRVPSGFDPEHPRAELLKYKGLHASSPQLDINVVTAPELVDVCFEHCRNMAPLQQWLVRLETKRP